MPRSRRRPRAAGAAEAAPTPALAPAPALAPVLVRGEPALPVTWWVRLRSIGLLGCLTAALGVAVAAGVGLVLVLLFGLLRSSVG